MQLKVTLYRFRENPPFPLALSQVIQSKQQIPPLPSTQCCQPHAKQFIMLSTAVCFRPCVLSSVLIFRAAQTKQ
jgi:hypothetical protein